VIVDTIYIRYFTTDAYNRALVSGECTCKAFISGNSRMTVSRSQTSSDEHDELFIGNQTLANSILRMWDSMMHFEFQSTIADGDIRHTMNIMSVSVVRSK